MAITRLYKYEQAAEILQVEVGTLKWWKAVGKGPDFVQVVGGIRYAEDDLARFIDAGRRANSVQANREKKRGALQAKA